MFNKFLSLGRTSYYISSFIAFLIAFPLYLTVNSINSAREGIYLSQTLENHIPFIPETVFIYLFSFMILVVPLFMVNSKRFFTRMLLAQMLTVLASCILFLFFPLKIERAIPGMGSFSEWMIGLVYFLDGATNCSPSLHVSNSFLSAMMCWKMSRRVGVVSYIVAAAISLSILTTKQHYVLDLVTGVLMAFVVFKVSFKNFNKDEVRITGELNALYPLAIYIFLVAVMYGVYLWSNSV